jgi:hypothetical protein
MSGQDWSIKIVKAGSGSTAAFVPSLEGAELGEPLQAQSSDLISWNNRTANTHQPWPTDENYKPLAASDVSQANQNYLSDPVAPWEPSSPAYIVPAVTAATTIYYCCKLHPQERGSITVSVTTG